ncbi:hypothetical protein TNIN_339861 [Trichonephila inaurata madagascariensis]|uniref:Uncharacterized protein n=1 Tax=Trichonephila inaurata madagascariensis TaxID=2747483 RepID=A0A8X6X2J5_9ARAC|nr:hypothetical protein TNIN_339861 [Trichonephila inaurata madagascariensis]
MASSDAAFENCPFFETPFRTFKEEREKKTEKEETSKRHDTAIFLKETSSFHPCPTNPIQENDNKKKRRKGTEKKNEANFALEVSFFIYFFPP